MAGSPLARPVMLPVGADLCLDFANTRYWRGSEAAIEELHVLGDVLGWLVTKQAMPDHAARELAAHWRARPRASGQAFAGAITLREMLWRLFSAVASGSAPGARELAALNEALHRAPPRTELRAVGDHKRRVAGQHDAAGADPTVGGYGWQVARLRPVLSDLLAPVLWSAADLLTGARLARLRRCANEKCLYLFVDDSRNGARRWCSMSVCGNRAKAHLHYVRHKQK